MSRYRSENSTKIHSLKAKITQKKRRKYPAKNQNKMSCIRHTYRHITVQVDFFDT